jgi:hypothetical protein
LWVKLLLFSAAYFLLLNTMQGLGIGLPFSKFTIFLNRVEGWTKLLIPLLAVRFLKPRLVLFVGLVAFAWQFNAAGILLPVAMNVPKFWLELVSLIVAVFIARAFSFGDESPADRVRHWFYLWFFAAAALFVMLNHSNSFWLRSWQDKLVWLSFLVSFVLLIDNLDSDELEPKAAGIGAGYGTLIPIAVSFFLVLVVVFEMQEVIDGLVPWSWGPGSNIWLPLLGCAGLVFGAMKYLDIGQRLPDYGPGRKLVFWGAILYGVGILAGGSIFGGMKGDGRALDFLIVFVYFAILVVPLMTVAVILAGTGLLRILFSLNARPR